MNSSRIHESVQVQTAEEHGGPGFQELLPSTFSQSLLKKWSLPSGNNCSIMDRSGSLASAGVQDSHAPPLRLIAKLGFREKLALPDFDCRTWPQHRGPTQYSRTGARLGLSTVCQSFVNRGHKGNSQQGRDTRPLIIGDTARGESDTLSRRAPDAIGLVASGEAARPVHHTSCLCSCGETF